MFFDTDNKVVQLYLFSGPLAVLLTTATMPCS
jgi:hypothetical protein